MPLLNQTPRRFALRRTPAYPSVLAAGLLVAVTSCRGASATASGRDAPLVSADGSSTANADFPAPRRPGDHSAATGLLDAQRASAFPEDNKALDLNVGCKGDCPSPFELAVRSKDRAQVGARVEHCARAARSRGAIPTPAFEVRAEIGVDGRASGIALDAGSAQSQARESQPLPSDDLVACLKDLVQKARWTPPEKGASRTLWVPVTAEMQER